MKNLVRIKEVIKRTGISKSQVYALSKQGDFPLPVKLSNISVAWVLEEIELWIEDRINQRDFSQRDS